MRNVFQFTLLFKKKKEFTKKKKNIKKIKEKTSQNQKKYKKKNINFFTPQNQLNVFFFKNLKFLLTGRVDGNRHMI